MGDVSGPGSGGEAAPLSADHLRRLCAFLYARTGMSFGEAKRYFIERRVADRMVQAGVRSVPVYLTRLQSDAAEVEALINCFTVNETYFYREDHQLRCMSAALLPEIVAGRRPGDLVRIWSVPCSTGEEPYSVAIWLLENWRLVDAYNVEIVGSDIDTRVLTAAALGQYGGRALGRLPPPVLERYFEAARGDTRRIVADLRESVRFSQVNLIDAGGMAAQGRFDIILCRNVLIYFDAQSRIEAACNLFAALNPGGFLCLGHTESMARVTDRFRLRRFDDAIVYQRPFA